MEWQVTVKAVNRGGPSGVFTNGVFFSDKGSVAVRDVRTMPLSSEFPGPSKICDGQEGSVIDTRPGDNTGFVRILNQIDPPFLIVRNIKVKTTPCVQGRTEPSTTIHGKREVIGSDRPQVSCQPINPAPTEEERCSPPGVINLAANREESPVSSQPINPAPTETERCSPPRVISLAANKSERSQVLCQPINPAPTETERCSPPRVISLAANRSERLQVSCQPINPAPTGTERANQPRVISLAANRKERPQLSRQSVDPAPNEPGRCTAHLVMSPAANRSERPQVSCQPINPAPTESDRCSAPQAMSLSKTEVRRTDLPPNTSEAQAPAALKEGRQPEVETTPGKRDDGVVPRKMKPSVPQNLPMVRCYDGQIRACKRGQLLKRTDGEIVRITDDHKPQVIRPPPSTTGNFSEPIVIDSESDKESVELTQNNESTERRRAFVLDSETDTSPSTDSGDEFHMNHTDIESLNGTSAIRGSQSAVIPSENKRQSDVTQEPARIIRRGCPKKNIGDQAPKRTPSGNPIQWGEIRKSLQRGIPRTSKGECQAPKQPRMDPLTNPSESELTHFNCPIEPEILITEEGRNLLEDDILAKSQPVSSKTNDHSYYSLATPPIKSPIQRYPGAGNLSGLPHSLGPMNTQQPQPVQSFESANFVTPNGEVQLDPELYGSYIENLISNLRSQQGLTQEMSTPDIGSEPIPEPTRDVESTKICQRIHNGGRTRDECSERRILDPNIGGAAETVITMDASLDIAPSVVVLDKLKDIPDGTIRLNGEEGTSSWNKLFVGNCKSLFYDHVTGTINEEMNKPERIRALVEDRRKVVLKRKKAGDSKRLCSSSTDRRVNNSDRLWLFNPVSRIQDVVRQTGR